jgi:hypothetical protein
VDVSPGNQGSGTILGNVTCQTTNPLTPITVTLTAESEVGTATLDNPTIEFQGTHQSEEIQVVVTVELYTTASGGFTCTLSGTWQQGAQTGDITPTTTQVVVLPFSLCNIINTETEKTVETGSSVRFDLKLENQGNCDDVYDIEITNRDDLESNGITVEHPEEVAVLQGATELLFITAHVSSDCKADTLRIDVTVTGTADEDSEKFRAQLDARIEEGHIRANNPLGAFFVFILIIAIIIGLILFARRYRKEKSSITPPNQ